MNATREPLVGLAERLRVRMERWTGNGDDAWMNVKLGEVRALFTALEEQSRRVEELEAALNKIAFLSTNHGGWFETDPWDSYAELGDFARTALSPSDTEEKP